MKSKKHLFFAFFAVSSMLKADPGIKVQAKMNYKKKAMEISCVSEKNYPCTVEIVLDELENFDKKYKRGDVIHLITQKGINTTLSIKANTALIPRICITSDFVKGNLMATPNLHHTYLLPVANGKSTVVDELSYVGKISDKDLAPKNWYSLSFKTEAGDTIYASRRGIVTGLRDNNASYEPKMMYASQENFIEIFHGDGTFANYRLFRNNGIFVKEGDIIEAGDPIGIIGAENYLGGSHLRFSVYRPIIDKHNETAKGDYFWEYLRIRFCTSESDNLALSAQKTYQAVKPQNLITLEMSKSEKKNYYKSRSNALAQRTSQR